MDTHATSHGEAPLTLDISAPAVRSLGLRDQLTLWASLGVSLLIPATAAFVVQPIADMPRLNTAAVTTAIVLGTAVGSVLLALAASISTALGTPAMATLRGLLGRRGSLVPTLLNLVQCCGWAALEVFVIAQVATALAGGHGRVWWTLAAGSVATVLAIRPIRSVRLIRRYLMWLVLLATAYLLWHVLSHMNAHSHEQTLGTWQAFWPAFDIVVTMPISWVVLAGDWSRHSTSRRATVVGVGVGYGAMCAIFFLIGAIAVTNSADIAQLMTPTAFVNALLVVPVGAVAIAILAVDEVDEAFANVYSTAVSAQNMFSRVDRRVAAAAVGLIATGLALTVNLESYEAFLLLIGAVFLPLVAVMLTDWFIVRWLRNRSAGAGFSVALSDSPTARYFIVWLFGVCVYSTISPAQVPGWAAFWSAVAARVPSLTSGHNSATLIALSLTSLATLAVGLTPRR